MRPLRLLICNYEYPPIGGGASTASAHLAEELAALGHRVAVVTAAFSDLPRRERHHNLRIRRVPALRRRQGQSNPIEMISFVLGSQPALLAGRTLPDAILSFHSIPSGLAAFPTTLLRGVPHVVLLRGGDVPGWLPGELDFYHRATLPLNRWIVHRADVVLANSDGLRDLAAKSFPRARIGVLRNGVDIDRYTPREHVTPGAAPLLLFAGRLTTQKGVDVLLRMLGGERLRPVPWRLEIAGTGPQLPAYRQIAEDLGLASRVTFLDWVPREQLRRRYREADLFVFPSRYEGMPNVVLEAAACGLPVVGTRIAGTEEIVVDGTTGFLAEVDDVAAMEEALLRLLTDADLRTRMGAAARKRVAATWSWRARAAELVEFIAPMVRRR